MTDNGGPAQDPFLRMMQGAYTDPRSSVRALLNFQPDERTRLLMVLIGVVVAIIGVAISGGLGGPVVDPETGERIEISRWSVYGLLLIFGWLQYKLFSFLMAFAGSIVGGAGDGEACRTAVAWWALMTAPIQLLPGLLSGISPMLGPMALSFSVLLGLWMLAAATAEAHGFRNTLATLGGILGVSFAVALLLSVFSLMLGGFAPQ